MDNLNGLHHITMHYITTLKTVRYLKPLQVKTFIYVQKTLHITKLDGKWKIVFSYIESLLY